MKLFVILTIVFLMVDGSQNIIKKRQQEGLSLKELETLKHILHQLEISEDDDASTNIAVREKRSVLSILKWTLTAVNLVCEAGKGLHHMARAQGWGHYGQVNAEMEFYKNETKKMKTRVICTKQELDGLNARLLKTFETFDYSIVLFNNVKKTHDRVGKGIELFKKMLTKEELEVIVESPMISKVINMAILDASSVNTYSFDALMTVGGDIMGGVGQTLSIELTTAASSLFANLVKGDGYVGQIGDTLGFDNLDGFVDMFDNIMSGVNIAAKVVKFIDCIRDHFGMARDHLEARNKMKIQYDNTKIALRDLSEFNQQIFNAIELFNNETERLVDYTNNFLMLFNSTCKTSLGSITSDLTEIKYFVQSIKDNFDLTVTLETALKTLLSQLEITTNFMKTMGIPITDTMVDTMIAKSSPTIYSSIRAQFPDMNEELLLKKMENAGFIFPKETWTKWTKVQSNQSCSCQEDLGLPAVCFDDFNRDCISGECLGPSTKKVNICKKDQLHFFAKCKNRDEAMRGLCITRSNDTLDTGDVRGRYVSTGVTEKKCFRDCKSLPGSRGCQFVQTSCLVGTCSGDCYGFTEEVVTANKVPWATCYKFVETSPGRAETPLLRQVFDATKQMMVGKEYDTVFFNDLYLSLMKIDPEIITSQENAWREMFMYQHQQQDIWGENPSDFSERNIKNFSLTQNSVGSKEMMTVREPCNFASNWGYYHLAAASSKLKWVPKEKKKALGQAAANLAFSSAFFHGSHTRLGQDLDNLMIKIIVLILHQTLMDTNKISNPLLTDFSIQKRPQTAVQMAQYVTDMFRNQPASLWSKTISDIDVPSYEITFSGFTLTLLAQLNCKGSKTKWAAKKMMKNMMVPQKDIDFLIGEFMPEVADTVINMNQTHMQIPDVYNSIASAFRLLAALPFQETYNLKSSGSLFSLTTIMKTAYDVLVKPQFPTLHEVNDALDGFSTLPQIAPLNSKGTDSCGAVLLGRTEEIFPGKSKCEREPTTKHSVWHGQSAMGILDLFKLVDEYAGKQVELNKPEPEQIKA